MNSPRILLGSARAALIGQSRSLRTVGVGLVVAAVMLGSVASVSARHDDGRTLKITWTNTSFSSTQSDPSVFKTGDEISLGFIVHRFTSPKDDIGTAALHCAAAGSGGTSVVLLCDAAFTLPDGKITTSSLFDLQTEAQAPVRKLAITGGTGAYLGAGGVLTVTSLSDTDEMGVFNFDD